MASQPVAVLPPPAAVAEPQAPAAVEPVKTTGLAETLGLVAELSKARLSSLVIVTTAVGYSLASPLGVEWLTLLLTLVGTTLCAFAANAYNQWVECPWDARMARTKARPLPSGRMSSRAALAWATGFLLSGGLILGLGVNMLTAGLAVGTAALYVGFYTPLKRRTSLNTLVGAVCGAIPPLVGWAGAAGELPAAAWVLFGILFVWQIPHFLAIDWKYREDYGHGGFRMLSSVDPSGRMTGQQCLLYAVLLLPISLLATPFGMGGWLYPVGALILGLVFVSRAWDFYRERTDQNARRVFLASLAYLPLVLGLLALDPTRIG